MTAGDDSCRARSGIASCGADEFMFWVEPRWIAPLRHRRAVRAVLVVWLYPEVFLSLVVLALTVAVFAARLAVLPTESAWQWTKQLMQPLLMVSVMLVCPLLFLLYVLVAYVSRLAVIKSSGIFIAERWYPKGSVKSVKVRYLKGGRRMLRVGGTARKPSTVAVPDHVTDPALRELLLPLLAPQGTVCGLVA